MLVYTLAWRSWRKKGSEARKSAISGENQKSRNKTPLAQIPAGRHIFSSKNASGYNASMSYPWLFKRMRNGAN
jgi:hypothetical protein